LFIISPPFNNNGVIINIVAPLLGYITINLNSA
jgi:hypothetical protein